jgi:deazaflavin-dependent oxidoreductase (nitroreductase family)
MMFHRDGDRVLVIASGAGAPRHPDWYLNLVANPAITIEIGDESGEPRSAIATPLEGEEYTQVWTMIKCAYPFFVDHEAKTERTIPVVAIS